MGQEPATPDRLRSARPRLRRRVAVVDPRRHVPRTDVVLADPRLVAARELLGGALVAFCFPKREEEEALLDAYQRADVAAAASSPGSP